MSHKPAKRARVQVQQSELGEDERPPQNGTVFNIWYQKWSHGDSKSAQVKAKYRCQISRDSGYTKAKDPGSYFCLYFARGMCSKGHRCDYLHRLPAITDIYPPAVDCFGRDRFSSYRDDMGGVGSFLQPNRVLYVGNLNAGTSEEVISRHFSEWGEIERVNLIASRNCAFVTFRTEINAQFAKEAMAHQSLDGQDEVLNVRWASEDPNPNAKAREKRRRDDDTIAAIENIISIKRQQDKSLQLENSDAEGRTLALSGNEQLADHAPNSDNTDDGAQVETNDRLEDESDPDSDRFFSDRLLDALSTKVRDRQLAQSKAQQKENHSMPTSLQLVDYDSD